MPDPENFEAVVIGSGFGGTILTLSLANKFEADNTANNSSKKVCVLERGQWWLSHEINFTPPDKRKSSHHKNMREFLYDDNRPFKFWPHPDNVKGTIEIASAVRDISKTGLYDYRILGKNVHVIASSGVGGGSLVYSNVTLRPEDSAFASWPTQNIVDDPLDKKFSYREVYIDEAEARLYANNTPDFDKIVDIDTPILDYFDIARNFIGVNKITTNAALTKNKLEKTKVFQDAAQELLNEQLNEANVTIVNKQIETPSGNIGDFDIDLSITDMSEGIFSFDKSSKPIKESRPLISEVNKYTSITQTNDCQRQGRCNLGCIPGARHTLNKRLFAAMSPKSGDPKPLEIKELCEVYDIEYINGKGYKISYFQHDKETEQKEQKEVMANILVVSAGSLGSTELLLKCKRLQLSDKLGATFYTNGDLFAYMTLDKKRIDITRGPINTSHITFKTAENNIYTIEDTTIPKIVAPLFATVLELDAKEDVKIGSSGFWRRTSENLQMLRRFGFTALVFKAFSLQKLTSLFTKVWNNKNIRRLLNQYFITRNTDKPNTLDNETLKFLQGLIVSATTDYIIPFASPEERMSKFFVFSCMGRGEKPGVLGLKDGELSLVDWSSSENSKLFEDMLVRVKQIASKIESGAKVYTPLWSFKDPSESTSIVLHPLSGCNMGNDVNDGVVNSYGQVFWNDGSADKNKVYPKLYVVDGSIIPEALGVNPSLTISAVAFRSARHLLREILEPSLPPEQENQYLPK